MGAAVAQVPEDRRLDKQVVAPASYIAAWGANPVKSRDATPDEEVCPYMRRHVEPCLMPLSILGV